jgi:hypothetical protein
LSRYKARSVRDLLPHDSGEGSNVNIIKLAWVGTRTTNDHATVAFFHDVLDLPVGLELPGFRMMKPAGRKQGGSVRPGHRYEPALHHRVSGGVPG